MFQREGLAGLLSRYLEGSRWLRDRRGRTKDESKQKEGQLKVA
jgi:hypothetical protein